MSTSVKRPKNAGHNWKGIDHDELHQEFDMALADRGWEVREGGGRQHFSTNNQESCLIMQATHHDIPCPCGRWLLGLRHSNNRRLATRAYLCVDSYYHDWTIVLSELVVFTRLTKTTPVKECMDRTADSLATEAMSVKGRHALMQRNLQQADYNFALTELAREGVVPWSRLRLVDDFYWSCPKQTPWAFLNAVAEVLSKSPPLNRLGFGYRALKLIEH